MAASVLVTAVAPEARAEDCSERFVPDRPGATYGHTTVGAGCLHIEAAADVTRSPGNTNLGFPSIVRMGLVQPLELRLSHSIVGIDVPDDGDTEVSAAPVGLEVKWMALEAEGRHPGLGVMFGAFAPANSDFGDQITPVFTWLTDWSFADGFGYSLNLIGSVPPVEGGLRAARFDYGTVLSAGIPVPGDWLTLFVDAAGGSASRDDQWAQKVGAGVIFLVASNLQLDASFDVVVTGDEHPVRAGVGIAWRL
ncbi:MAG TPA: transporter [Polyangiaceae bacterium]|nr:transporter [Polyangiaceae bacterium]